ncbi:MAG: STAS-like domain-containing protein [Candidatus Baldrarchaeia archaeon]
MNSSVKTIVIRKLMSPDLTLRSSADEFFDYIESLPDTDIIIDFKNVRSITRSFAHEYTIRKARSSKRIIEINVPFNISKMFDVVKKKQKKTILFDSNITKPIVLEA